MPFIGGSPVLIAIYPVIGVKFEVFTKSEKLQQEVTINNLMFFDAKSYESLLENGMFSMGAYNASDTQKIMYTWKGYGRVEELYPPQLP